MTREGIEIKLEIPQKGLVIAIYWMAEMKGPD